MQELRKIAKSLGRHFGLKSDFCEHFCLKFLHTLKIHCLAGNKVTVHGVGTFRSRIWKAAKRARWRGGKREEFVVPMHNRFVFSDIVHGLLDVNGTYPLDEFSLDEDVVDPIDFLNWEGFGLFQLEFGDAQDFSVTVDDGYGTFDVHQTISWNDETGNWEYQNDGTVFATKSGSSWSGAWEITPEGASEELIYFILSEEPFPP